ncbi:MAG: hypothetical protein II913_01240, partial [Elusimicrobiaceae bacterium]|nr:hypothetical protein [Elusimicrobiaceae bacterium]
ENQASIKRSLDNLDDRDRAIIIMRYGLEGTTPKTLGEVAEILSLSRERVRQIEERAIRALRLAANRAGIIEIEAENFRTRKLHSAMHTKRKTNILGEEFETGPMAKIMRAVRKQQKSAQKGKKSTGKKSKKVAKKKAHVVKKTVLGNKKATKKTTKKITSKVTRKTGKKKQLKKVSPKRHVVKKQVRAVKKPARKTGTKAARKTVSKIRKPVPKSRKTVKKSSKRR